MRTAARTEPLRQGEPQTRELALGLAYPDAAQRAGAVPVVIPPLRGPDEIEPLLHRLGGLLLSGGPDVHPAAYGHAPHPALGPTEPDLDAFELELLRRADAIGMPILALCRGAQVLNVARGGTLVQDLPDAVGTAVGHRQSEPGTQVTHPVAIAAGTRLEAIMGAGEHEVNSFHHQAADELGRGLRAAAWSPDGVVEAIEAVDREFVVGVQWHAESLVDRADNCALFEAWVDAAARFEAGATRRRAAA